MKHHPESNNFLFEFDADKGKGKGKVTPFQSVGNT